MIEVVNLTVGMAHDFSLETRVRRLLDAHRASGDEPRTLVMSVDTWREMVEELRGRTYDSGYFWEPQPNAVSFFRGIPILIKEFVAYGEVLVGV